MKFEKVILDKNGVTVNPRWNYGFLIPFHSGSLLDRIRIYIVFYSYRLRYLFQPYLEGQNQGIA